MRTKRPNARLHHTAPAKPATSVTGVVPGPGTTVTLGAGTANAGAAGSVATNGGVRTPPLDVVRQRILATVDPLSSPVISALQIAQRSAAVANLYLGMQQVKNSLQLVVGTIAIPVTPPQLIGVLLQPDGTPGKLLQVQFDPSTIGSAKPMITVQTDANGTFHLQLPQGLVMMGGGLTLLV
ncbi:MAG TPA: hypothetical protein VGN11_05550, partial [Candidatus Baltobacteraceae bacterium]|nr:hypothetical protein [Candidatus Baltobacteraceae bacterium]